MTRRDHPEIKCTRCGVSVKETAIGAKDRCMDARCPINAMVAAQSQKDKAA